MARLNFMNFGCGSIQPEGWVNIDRAEFNQDHLDDAGNPEGLPFATGMFDGIVASHSLQENGYNELPVVLTELRRVLRPGGVLRVLAPNLTAAVAAWQRGDRDWFPVNIEEPGLDDAFCCYLNWFGTAKTLCTETRQVTLLERAGFVNVTPAQFGVSRVAGLADLDDREPEEQIIVEAEAP